MCVRVTDDQSHPGDRKGLNISRSNSQRSPFELGVRGKIHESPEDFGVHFAVQM